MAIRVRAYQFRSMLVARQGLRMITVVYRLGGWFRDWLMRRWLRDE